MKVAPWSFPPLLGGDPAAMRLDDRSADRQAQPQSAETPHPAGFALIEGSKIVGSTSGSIPMPVSVTSTTSRSPPGRPAGAGARSGCGS